ncbi:NADase-type glycan-binding domain-containing protein [Streptomyces sp. NPDC056527]|uniref:NADase-type glycan-binding domain-containing protein n=1 Tax=Streptomyces sp. NPDC056527 TaxID=3345853 RepID=UPI0036788251
MRECPACGASNGVTDDFCGNCGAYLGWSDTGPVPETAGAMPNAPAPPAGSAAEAREGTAAQRVTSGPPTDAGSSPPAPSGAEPGLPAPSGAESARPSPADTRAAPSTPAPSAPALSTPPPSAPVSSVPAPPAPVPSAPVSSVPVSDTSAASGTSGSGPGTEPPAARPPAAPPAAAPAPVLPAKAVAPRPVVRPLVVSDDVTGVPCPSCGTPNPQDRRFCRRCAAPLTRATAPAPLPWWRTIRPFRRRTRAGSGRMVRFLVILAVVLALCAAGFLLLPAGRHLIEDTRDKLGKAKAVTATRVTASTELPGHPAADTTDGLSNRYWGVPGPGASVTYTFAKPFRLVDVIITNGASPSPEEYARQGRALQIDMEVTARDGRKVLKKLALSDKPGAQTFPTGISEVTAVRLTLDAPAGWARGRHIALAEVEFFQRS